MSSETETETAVGTIKGVSVFGNGANSAEMDVRFLPDDPTAQVTEARTLHVRAGSEPQVFAAMCALLLQAFQTNKRVSIETLTTPGATPDIVRVALPQLPWA